MKFTKTILLAALFLCAGLTASKAQSISTDLSNLWADTLGSSNMVYAGFGERKLKGNADSAGVIGAFNFNGNVAAIGGIGRQWMKGGPAITYTISGGLQLQAKIAPLKSFGLTNFFVNPFVASVIGTPMNGQNGGNIMNGNRVGAQIPIHTFVINKNPLGISIGGFYGNQTGTGPYNGNWAGLDLAVNYGTGSSYLAANDLYLRESYAWAKPNFYENGN